MLFVDKLPFKCANCGRRFKVEKYLKQHLARSCGTEPKFPCNECGHQFTRKAGLQIHLMKIHNVQKSQFATFGAGILHFLHYFLYFYWSSMLFLPFFLNFL